MRRVATGIWACKACKKTSAGGAYTLRCVRPGRAAAGALTRPRPGAARSTVAAATARSTIRRLRELTEA